MERITIKTSGHYDFINLTERVSAMVKKTKIKEGLVIIFVTGSTVALTTMEYEAGLMEDLKETLEKIAPEKADYHHHQKWGDHNGVIIMEPPILSQP